MSGNGSRTRSRYYGTTGDLLPTPRPCSGLRSAGVNQTELLMSAERLLAERAAAPTDRNAGLVQRTMFDDGPSATLWRTPSGQEPGLDPARLVDKDGNPPTHFNQRLYDKHTGRMAQHGLTQDVHVFSSPQASPASPSPTPGSGPARTTPGTSGLTLLPLFKGSALRGVYSKMLGASSPWGSTACALTWKPLVTKSGRLLCLLRASARSTGGTGSGLWQGSERMPFGTPTAGMGDKDAAPTQGMADRYLIHGKGGNLLETVAAQMFGTPTAASKHRSPEQAAGRAPNPQELARMWPTPCATEARQGFQDRSRGMKGSQESLSTTAMKANGQGAGGMKLNPPFVEALMGYPSGWMDDLPPDPLG